MPTRVKRVTVVRAKRALFGKLIFGGRKRGVFGSEGTVFGRMGLAPRGPGATLRGAPVAVVRLGVETAAGGETGAGAAGTGEAAAGPAGEKTVPGAWGRSRLSEGGGGTGVKLVEPLAAGCGDGAAWGAMAAWGIGGAGAWGTMGA